MLVLSRKEGQKLVISNRSEEPLVIPPGGVIAELGVMAINGKRVSLGAEAMSEVGVLRSELSAKVHSKNS